MVDKFKVNDLVEVTGWEDNIRRDWRIGGFASSGAEAVIFHTHRKERCIVKVSGLRHQRKRILPDKYYKEQNEYISKNSNRLAPR